jgi:hypothetical protein
LAFLHRNAPPLEEVYQAAVILLHSDAFPARHILIAHAVREIRNRLADYLGVAGNAQQVQYVNACDEIGALWLDQGLPLDGSIPSSPPLGGLPSDPDHGEIGIPREVFRVVSQLIGAHLASRQRRKEIGQRLVAAMIGDGVLSEGEVVSLTEAWFSKTEWAVKLVHVPGSTMPSMGTAELFRCFEGFEQAFHELLRGFYPQKDIIDEILGEANR